MYETVFVKKGGVYIEQILFNEICLDMILLRMKTKQISQKTLLAIVR